MARQLNKSGQKPSAFAWNKQKEKAALLIAQDELTDEQIAAELSVVRTTLWNWRQRPEFTARIQEHQAEIRQRIRSRGIAIVENRVRALQDRWDRMKRVIAERAVAPEMQGVPGGQTGLLCHDVKSVGAGALAERVDLYELDAALLRELREHEKQAAQELGQWTEKQELKTPEGIVVKVLRGVSMSELH